MANDVQSYQNLVTSEYQNQPNFLATIALNVGMSVQVQLLLTAMLTTIFDLDQPPVGDQLDIIGEWVGISRIVTVPISGVYFTWNTTDLSLGWDKGTWQAGGAPAQIVSLPDDAYLILIKAKIGANTWDGTAAGAYAIYETAFSPYTILFQDNCNMSYAIAIIGGVVPALTLALLTGGYIPLKPEGIRISAYYVSIDVNPAFCWDLNTAFAQGWDTASWLKQISP